MLNISTQNIYIYQSPVNMHKSFDGLQGIVERFFPDKLFTHSLFVFVNRQRDKMKIFYWDEDGLCFWYKRLEKGSFKVDTYGKTELSRREFLMLLEGIKPQYLNRRYSMRKSD
jgi:transposase